MPDHLTLGMRGNVFVTSAHSMIASSLINQCAMHQHMVSSVVESMSCDACA